MSKAESSRLKVASSQAFSRQVVSEQLRSGLELSLLDLEPSLSSVSRVLNVLDEPHGPEVFSSFLDFEVTSS